MSLIYRSLRLFRVHGTTDKREYIRFISKVTLNPERQKEMFYTQRSREVTLEAKQRILECDWPYRSLSFVCCELLRWESCHQVEGVLLVPEFQNLFA